MESANTFVDLLGPWMKVQQVFWERWRAAAADGIAPANPASETWDVAVEGWRTAIYNGLEVQLAWTELWKDWLCANDANIPEVTLGACQTLGLVEGLTRAEMQLWDGWFKALKGIALGPANTPAHTAEQAAKPRARV